MTETEQEQLHTQIAELQEQIADLKRRQVEHEGVPDDPIQEAGEGHKAMTCQKCHGHEIQSVSFDTGERRYKCHECGNEWSEFPGGWEGATPPIRPTNQMTKVYIAGPLRGNTPHDVEQNVRRARDVAELLWKEGFAVFCPHLNTYGMVGMLEDEDQFVEGDLLFLAACDVLVLLKGWRDSPGSYREWGRAEKLRIPRVCQSDSLEWAAERNWPGEVHWRDKITEAISDALAPAFVIIQH